MNQNTSHTTYSSSTLPKMMRSYRYGFQGQEKDDQVKGEGNSINYKYRMHDPRVGRFFAVDPLTKKYPHYSPYSFSGNKVIHAIELEGLEELEVNNEDGTTSINPAYKKRAILTLPDASTIIIYNAMNGGRHVIKEADLNKFRSFASQGYNVASKIAQYRSSQATQGKVVAGVGGTPNANDLTSSQYMSVSLEFPTQIAPQQEVNRPFIGKGVFDPRTGNGTLVQNQDLATTKRQATETAVNALNAMKDIIQNAPKGATVDDFEININLNENMTDEQMSLFKLTFNKMINSDDDNPAVTVNFGTFDPSDHKWPEAAATASSTSQTNSVTATQTSAPVQTLQIISKP